MIKKLIYPALILCLLVAFPVATVSAQTNKSSSNSSAKIATKREAAKKNKYPKLVKTRAGTITVNDESQEIGEILSEDPQLGYVAYTTPRGILLRRFTNEAIKEARKTYGDEIGELLEEANNGTGKRLFEKAIEFKGELDLLGVDSKKSREIVRDYLKNPRITLQPLL